MNKRDRYKKKYVDFEGATVDFCTEFARAAATLGKYFAKYFQYIRKTEGCERERVREIERERERDRQRQTDRERQTERHRQRETDRETQTDRNTDRTTNRKTDRQIDRQRK